MKNENMKLVIKHLRYLVILLLVSWSIGSVIGADTVTPPPTSDTTPAVAPGDTEKSSPAMNAERVKELATTYGVTEKQVLTMRQTSHMGWGEIKNMLLISQRIAADSANSTTPLTQEQALTQMMKQRQSGMGIGQIAKSYNVKLGDIKSGDKPNKPDKVERAEKPDKPEKVDKPEKPVKPDRPEKPSKVEKPDRPDKPGKGN